MTPTLYTIGYQRRELDEYIALLGAAGITVLVDVRETAWSHKRGFSKNALASALDAAGIAYVHARFAGNPKTLRATAPTHADCLARYATYVDQNATIMESLETLIADLVAAGERVCLTCFERHADDCHRGILADRWKRRGKRRVRHLATGGCERLVPA